MAYAFNDDKSKYDLAAIIESSSSASKTVTLPNTTGITYGGAKSASFKRIGNIVYARLSLIMATNAVNTAYTMSNAIPSGYRPAENTPFLTAALNSASLLGYAIFRFSGANITVSTSYKSNAEYPVSVMYYTNDTFPTS